MNDDGMVGADGRTGPEGAALFPGYETQQKIHGSRLRSIYRGVRRADGQPVVIKTLNAEYPSRQDVAELRREFQIIERLQPIAAVIRAHALETYGNGNVAIVLELFGRSLAERFVAPTRRRIPLEQFFNVAIAAADALGRMHELDVVHKNIEPRSILLDDSGAIRLIDFSMASELSLERQGDGLHKRPEGTLPYMSPEQTGRMNRDLDYRSDYYSLGVTFYELLTASLPFHGESVLEWVHSHISKAPRPPSDVEPSIPQAVSAIVLKLLAKNAEDRYQSSFGLIEDLARCQREHVQTGSVSSFDLGRRDVSRWFQIPQRLYGRDPELAALLDLFEKAASGSMALCMVSGHSGIGKSALVNELSKPIARQRGYLIQGKFDQFKRSTPYSAVAMAFRSLLRELLVEPQERKDALARQLLTQVAPNAQLLIDLIPELELLIGVQPAVPELARTEAQNRFQIAFLAFVRVITSEQPLVVFLDDLQFSDASTLNLIRGLATARDLGHLLLIGAYRSNEVDVGHPLRLALNDIEESRPIRELPLQPLEVASVEHLLADALHAERAACGPLAALLHQRTRGNPFFLTEMLKTLERAHLIAFVPDAGRWRWDIEAIRGAALSGNVVDFVVEGLRELDIATQRVLQLAACIGHSFDLRTLSIIHEQSMDATGEALIPALQRQMIVPLNEDYRLAGKAGGADVDATTGSGLNPSYRFQHDRVQQAAYALISADRKQAVHLSVGRLIQRHTGEQECEERLIDIVGHLNEGRRLIDDPGERDALARMNLAAGVKAQRSSAYEAALGYLRIAHELAPAQPWASDYVFMMALATETQQCAYLTARYDEAESWVEQVLEHARSPLEKAEILSMRTRQYATLGKMDASIEAAIKGLSLLGMPITANPDRAAIRREIAAARRNLAGRRVADLIDSPPLTDPAQKVAIRLLMEIFPAAFLSGSGNLFPFLVLKLVNISLRGGNSTDSAFAYAAYGMLLCGALDDPALGLEYGQLAVAMNDRSDDIALKSRVIYVYAMFVHHWSNHWSTMTPWFRRGIESGYQSGDLLYLAYSAQDCIIWDPKLDLETAEREHAQNLQIVRDCKYRDSLDSGTLFLQMQRNFLGLTDGLCSMNDVDFDEQRCVDGMRQRRFFTGIANYHIYKAEICALYGRYAEALEHVRVQDQLIASAMSLPQLVRFYIVAFLTLAACLPGMSADEQIVTRKRLRADLKRMRRWAAHCPANFLHLQLLMQAELARLDGRAEQALRLFEQAAEAAHAAEFRRDEAVVNELAARHLLAAGRRKAAEGYLRAARNHFQRWGARRKVEQLQQEFPQLFAPTAAGNDAVDDELRATGAALDPAALDMASVMKASQAISSEVSLEQLWTTTMRVMLENTGGRRGCFVVRKNDKLMITGLSEVGRDAADAGLIAIETADSAAALLPMSIVFHVLQSNNPVVLHHAAADGPFIRDAYVVAHRSQSVLCLPLRRQGRFEGAIFMENSLAAGVFTEDRIAVIKLLAAQVSISIENATLYEEQGRLIAAQRRFVPRQFLDSLGRNDIASVDLGEHVAKTMSVIFADLRGFTPLAERLDARNIIDLLNRYFLIMEQQITEAGGFIDSFAGDEIMALFDTSADGVVRAGIGMWRALEAFNRRAAALGQPELNIGIGANTGPVILGTVGGRDRIQCTVIGDTVNTASRIEQLTKVYGSRFLIGERTFRDLVEPKTWAIRRVDRVAVKGKNIAFDLYEIIDAEPAPRRAAKLATRELIDGAMHRYFGGGFEAAAALFEKAHAADPADAVPVLFAGRCSRYLREPPPADWKGYETLTEK